MVRGKKEHEGSSATTSSRGPSSEPALRPAGPACSNGSVLGIECMMSCSCVLMLMHHSRSCGAWTQCMFVSQAVQQSFEDRALQHWSGDQPVQSSSVGHSRM